MLSLPPSVRIFLCAEPADMRRSFDGLAFLVEHFLKHDPLSGHLFVFRNKLGDRVVVFAEMLARKILEIGAVIHR